MDGTVTHLDRHTGLGTVTTPEGRVLGFHSIRIADGTRDIAVGTAVRFEVVAGMPGRWEATDLVAVRS
ncbi:MAG TPA: hypothetical protein VFF40_08915 [Acidimicrobiia bacterium]|nr:hypothetical protein [Acidimicrobiia bacterium]